MLRAVLRRPWGGLFVLLALAAPLLARPRAALAGSCVPAGSPPAYTMGSTDMEGIHYPGVPPEPCIAVGPKHILVVGPGDVRVFDKATGQMLSSRCQNVFFQTSTGCLTGANPVFGDGGGLIDPDCYYDRIAGRFVAVSFSLIGTGSGHVQSHLHLAVSQTSNPLDPWYVYHTATALSPWAPGHTMVPDRPSLGVSLDKVAIAAHMFSYDGGPDFTLFRVMDRDSLYGHLLPDAANVDSVSYYDFVDLDTLALNYRLGRNTTPDPVLHAVSAGGWERPLAEYRSLTGPAAQCALSNPTFLPLAFPASYGRSRRAPQAGSSLRVIDELDTMPNPSALWVRNRTLSLAWNQPHAFCAGETLSVLHLLRLHVAAPTPAGAVLAALMDTLYGDSGAFYAFPAICDDSLGRIYMGFQGSSATTFPSCYVTGKLPTDATMERSPTLVKAGQKAWTRADGGGNVGRWGDFSTIDLDESVSTPVAYYVGEWVKAGATLDTLGTWIRSFSFATPTGAGNGPSASRPALDLEGAWPNPARTASRIRFTLGATARVRLEVVDAEGRRVRLLADGAYAPGAHDVSWDLRDATGEHAAAGVYLCRATSGGTTATAKITVLR